EIAERAVDARKTDVGDGIELLERFHQLLADHRRRHFALAAREEFALEVGSSAFHLTFGDRALLARFAQPAQDLLAIVLFAAAVFFHDEETRRFHPLVGREAVLAA